LVIARIVTSVFLLAASVASMADTTLEPDEYVVFHHHDALGNTIVTTGANGEVLWFEQTEPYGKTLGKRNGRGSGLAVDPFHEEEGRSRPGYTGHVRDGATGLTYMQARHYSSELGRFLSNDPIGVNFSNLQSFNRYAYANNNPYRYVDPDGRWVEDVFIGVPSVGVGLYSFGSNVRNGNWGSAAVDLGGVVADVAAIAAPGAPGGAGLLIKAGRLADSTKTESNAGDVLKGGAKPDFVVSKNGTALPTNKDFNLVDAKKKDGDWLQVHSTHTDAKAGGNPHTHWPTRHNNSRRRETARSDGTDLDLADDSLRGGTMRERTNRSDHGGVQ